MEQNDELTLRLALTKLRRLKPQHLRLLYETLGSAVEIYNSIDDLDKHIPSATHQLRDELAMIDCYTDWARDEINFAHDNGIDILCHDDSRFPALLNQCDDAPTVLYSLGHADYNARHIVASVGTRRCTEYGKSLCRRLCADLGSMVPDALLISGLAYGIDIESHRAALDAGVATVAVVAHGLDDLYPATHRSTANAMLKAGGGLLTEYPHGTRIEKINFISRNRIVAGMSHATIVVESAEKGGALITAELAGGYNREVFAYPGRVGDTYSAGCNKLIANHKAHLMTDVRTMMQEMGWSIRETVVQGCLFPTLSPEEESVRNVLQRHDVADIDTISSETGIGARQLATLLSTMEMDGKLSVTPGSGGYSWNI